MSINLQDLVGKTITKVEENESQYGIPGTVSITLHFDDGSHIDVCGRGCDEGGWLEFYGSGL